MSTTIRHYTVEITDGTGIIKHASGFRCYEVQVVAESEKQIVVTDTRYGNFVVIEKEKKPYYQCINIASISISTADTCFGNRVSYSIFTTKNIKAATIKAAIEREIQRKLGFFIKGIDLECIKD